MASSLDIRLTELGIRRHDDAVKVAELVLKYVQTLVWPMTVVILAWHFRAHLRRIMERMTRLETPAATMEFAADVRIVQAQAEEVEASLEEPTDAARVEIYTTPADAEVRDRATPRVSVYPATLEMALTAVARGRHRAGVDFAWRAVEREFFELTGQLPTISVVAAQGELQHRGFTPEVVRLYGSLRRLNGKLRHQEAPITENAALNYITSVETVVSALRLHPTATHGRTSEVQPAGDQGQNGAATSNADQQGVPVQ
ncbi:hypothetical protein [Streptomyces umbrinus]|uniref:hypothetical protein n=1 Tax=Streptomyces umbrinus TaxID=67370 RepID=UPI00343AFC3C